MIPVPCSTSHANRARVPAGMSRRHFMSHLSAATGVAASATAFTSTIAAEAAGLWKRGKSCILLWMGGGPSTIDIWDLKPGSVTGGLFKPIGTTADGVEICEHMPLMAKQMHHMSIVRSMSTREADHGRGRYYMHTGYVPDQNVVHASYGAVIAHELAPALKGLEIPPFVSIGSGSVGPGFLGMTWAPFVVDFNGHVRNLDPGIDPGRLNQRLRMLDATEKQFIKDRAGIVAEAHASLVAGTVKVIASTQMKAFDAAQEPAAVRERYGESNFGRGCLMARRLVEIGVPFVEVDLGGWDNHSGIFRTLADNKLPDLDRAMSALVSDLADRGMLDDTVLVWMGEFGRTPSINAANGRDHWARCWSVVVGGGGFKRGVVVGQTNRDGTEVVGQAWSSEDLMASVLKALGVGLQKVFTDGRGRPMRIANAGNVIPDLFT